ncbi:E3 ubiquitin-protein ligase ubr1, partial [Coemansia sp. RSA 2705]
SESNDDVDDDADDDEEEEGEEDYMACVTPASVPAAARSGRLMAESSPAAFAPFLQNILDHARVFGTGGGLQPSAATAANSASLSNQPQGVKGRSYPFDRAAVALFTHSIELLELSQRGTRNPPVFSHEDLRSLPSGTLSDGIPESLAIFMHMVGKIPELHYRTMFGTAVDTARAGSAQPPPAPAQRLRALIEESRLQVSSAATLHPAGNTGATASVTAGDTVAHTRLDMLKDLANTLAPLIKPASSRSREFACEQSRWHTGHDGMPARPFLMQDTFALFSEMSQSLVGPFGLDMWHLTRLFLTAELVRICVAVGDSVLGEYSGAPKALRIAQSLPHGAENYCANMTSPVLPASQSPSEAPSRVPQPWVDAPEARDVDQLSVLWTGRDAEMLEASAAGIHGLVIWAIRQMQGPDVDNDALDRLRSTTHPITMTKLVATLLLPFLRRVALVFSIQHGLDIGREAPWLQAERHQALGSSGGSTQVMSPDEPEVERLLKFLNLPKLHQIFDPETQAGTLALAEGWLRDLRQFRRRHASPMSLGAGFTMAVPVCMPTPYSLVELPEGFEVLFERSAKAFCPRCNSVPSDPALCLLCGNFVCVQGFCCQEDGIGECNMHMKTCGGTIGVYLLVKKCGLVLLHHDNGCFMSAPYLDQHGEVDLGLKRGRPLYLNHGRYEEMRRLVLTQKIPVFIARKIDQSFDIGGWVSL